MKILLAIEDDKRRRVVARHVRLMKFDSLDLIPAENVGKIKMYLTFIAKYDAVFLGIDGDDSEIFAMAEKKSSCVLRVSPKSGCNGSERRKIVAHQVR